MMPGDAGTWSAGARMWVVRCGGTTGATCEEGGDKSGGADPCGRPYPPLAEAVSLG